MDSISANRSRREVLEAPAGGAALAASSALAGTALAGGAAAAIRPFRFEAAQADLDDLRHRLKAIRWPERERVNDTTEGVRLATIQALARYWTDGYEWRRCEARLDGLPQFSTEIDGLDTHFTHVRSKEPNALPIIITHGWPGSVIEQLKIIGPLTNPTAHGGSPADAFVVVTPRCPDTDFRSSRPRPAGTRSGSPGRGACR